MGIQRRGLAFLGAFRFIRGSYIHPRMFLTPDLLSEYIECREVKEQVVYVAQWHDLISTYFKPEDVVQAMTIVIAKAEEKKQQ